VRRADINATEDVELLALTAADLAVGSTYETDEVTLEPADVAAFARKYDPQPMHLDETLAAGTVFSRMVASGWHVLALTMRLMVDARPFGATPIIGVELTRIRFRRPVPPATKLRVRARLDKLEPVSHPERAVALLTVETLEASAGEVLVEQQWKERWPRNFGQGCKWISAGAI